MTSGSPSQSKFFTARYFCAGAMAAVTATVFLMALTSILIVPFLITEPLFFKIIVLVSPTLASFLIGMPLLVTAERSRPISFGDAAFLGHFAGLIVTGAVATGMVNAGVLHLPIGFILFFMALLATAGSVGGVTALAVMRGFDHAHAKGQDA